MIIAIAGLAVGILALALGLLAIGRTVPALVATLQSDGTWMIRNSGPDTLVVVAAYAIDEDQVQQPLGRWVATEHRSEMEHMRMLMGTEENPWCKSRRLPPHIPFRLESGNVGTSVHIEYRIEGVLGRWPTKRFSPPWE